MVNDDDKKIHAVIAALETQRFVLGRVDAFGNPCYGVLDTNDGSFVTPLEFDKAYVQARVNEWNFFGGTQWTDLQTRALLK